MLSKIDSNKVTFEFDFFSGGKNKNFDEAMRSIGVFSDNTDFLDFLQSDICKHILISKKLKIHLEKGNINYSDQDTTKGIIDYDFVYSSDYVGYFDWLIHGLDSYRKTKLDIISDKNAKYLFYRYNDILQKNNFEVKKN